MRELRELIIQASRLTESCRSRANPPQARRYERAQRMLVAAMMEVRKAEVLAPLRVGVRC